MADPNKNPARGAGKKAAARERIAAKRAAEAAARAAEQRRRRTVLGGAVAAAVVVIAVVVAIVVQTSRTSTDADAARPDGTSAGGNGYTFTVGQADAPVTVDLYEDFQCPNCKDFEDAAGSTLEQLAEAGTVQIVYHGMAFLDSSQNDDYSTRALNAAAVVASSAGSDAYETFHDLLYANQPDERTGSGLTDDQLVAYAEQAGATGEDVAADIRDLVYGEWVKGAEDQASKDGVTGTPTVLVDGTKLTDLSAAGLTAAVQAASS
ncbi:Protein-disulfide isomerase [Klenkia soli]|uniref:Protein-disulfide isomerase n=1 Tax=Klenkia soli TaxID=1052260 RepID=A0A1H0BSZ2_9ACTN|nr:thioredoxin domain-containing protein [Klenkia soli]SDN48685.1 Protein-disulfide isomerase [Klenkia soli]